MSKRKKYTWKINCFDVEISQLDFKDVIKTIHYTYSCEKEDFKVHKNGMLHLELDINNFVDFDEISKNIIVSWLESKLDVVSLKENLSKRLDDKITPKTKTIKVNWN